MRDRKLEDHISDQDEKIGRLGIIGGGQLGMYLCDAARELGVATTVVAHGNCESAAYTADEAIFAELDDPQAVLALIAASDVVTFELEAIPDATMKLLEAAELRSEVRVFPRLNTMNLLRDKGIQKTWLHEQGLPTLPFVILPASENFSMRGAAPLCLPLVQKACLGGYDGKGVQMIRTEQELESAWPVASVLEPLLEDRVEVSVIVVRRDDGGLVSYPPVSMGFDDRFNAVFSVVSPATVPVDMQLECETIASRAVDALDGVGVFAVEFFVDADNHIYINEISPRVHNSGHLTMEAFSTSQFEQHVRAVMGLPPVPVVRHREFAVMLNILYDDSWEGVCPSEPGCNPVKLSLLSQAHWYGKPAGRTGRKMGHVTTLGNSAAHTEAEALRALASLRCTGQDKPAKSIHLEESTCH